MSAAVAAPARRRLFLARPRFWAAALALVAVALLAGPRLWAWYCYRAAEDCLARHHPRQARAWLAPCLRVWPDRADVQLLAGRAARLCGDLEAAERHLTACQEREGKPSDASVLEWALLRAEGGEVKRVEPFLRAEVERRPDQSAPVLKALAAGYLRLYRLFDALRCLETCLRYDPDDPQALYLRGQAWERVHAYPRAAADYERVVAHDPGHDDARLRLANAWLENGEPARAVAHLEELRRRTDDPEVLIRLAFAWNALGRLEDATRLTDQVLERHPGLPAAVSARGQLAFHAERLEEAESFLRQAITANPFDRQARYVLYQCLEQQGKKEEAAAEQGRLAEVERTIERLIAISNRLMPSNPRDPALHHELGTILLRMGHEELGVRWLQSALEQDPRYRPAHESLAAHFEQAGRPELAAGHRQQLLRP